MNPLKIIILGCFLNTLQGCQTVYTYSHVGIDGSSCSVTVESYRDLQDAALQVGENCALNSHADTATTDYTTLKNTASILGTLLGAAK